MTHTHRRMIALAFIVGFIISAPLLLMYASGFRYNKKRGILEGYGAITIETVPKGARVFINDEEWEGVTPARINNLQANIYKLRVEKEGYTRWQDEVSVQSGENEIYRDITLFRKTIPTSHPILESFAAHAYDLVWHDDVFGWAVIKSTQNETSESKTGAQVFVWDLSQDKIMPLEDFADAIIISAAARPTKRGAAILYKNRGKSWVSIISSPRFGSLEVSLHKAPVDAEQIEWSVDGSSLWLREANAVVSTDEELRINRTSAIIADDVQELSDNTVVTLEPSRQGSDLRARSLDDLTRYETISLLPSRDYRLVQNPPQGVITLHNPLQASLTIMMRDRTDTRQAVVAEVAGARWNREKYLYLWNNIELSWWDISSVYKQPQGDENMETQLMINPRTITRTSKPITSSFFDAESGHVFYATSDGLFALDIFSSSPQQIFPLYEGSGLSILGMTENKNRLFLMRDGAVLSYSLE